MAKAVRKEITPLTPSTLSAETAAESLDEAYALVKDQTEKGGFSIAAWKLGGTTPAAQKGLKIDTLFFAPIHSKELLIDAEIVPGFEVLQLKTESEVALHLSAQADAIIREGVDAIKAAPLEHLFDGWSYAFEMPSPTITNAGDFGVPGIVMDRCAAGCLVLGKAHAYHASTSWTEIPLTVEQNGKVIAEGTTSDLVAPADVCARDFLIEALKHGFTPKAGQWIATGGMTPAKDLEKDAQVTLKAGDQVVLSIKTGW